MEKDRQRTKKYRRTPDGKEKHQKQMLKYLRVRRHTDSVLKELMDETEILSLSGIADRIYQTKQVRMKAETIQNRLKYYLETYGQSPLETGNGINYKLNHSYFKSHLKKKY